MEVKYIRLTTLPAKGTACVHFDGMETPCMSMPLRLQSFLVLFFLNVEMKFNPPAFTVACGLSLPDPSGLRYFRDSLYHEVILPVETSRHFS